MVSSNRLKRTTLFSNLRHYESADSVLCDHCCNPRSKSGAVLLVDLSSRQVLINRPLVVEL